MKKVGVALAVLLVALSILGLNKNISLNEKEYNVGEKFTEKEINLGDNAYVLQILNVDLNKDKKNERVYLVGNPSGENELMYYEKLTYIIQDGKTRKKLVQTLKNNGEYLYGMAPEIQVVDLNRDGQNDIFLRVFIEANWSFYDVSTIKDGKLIPYLTPKDFNNITISGEFVDNYLVKLNSKELKKSWTIDVSKNKDIYEGSIYDSKGKVLQSELSGIGPDDVTIDTKTQTIVVDKYVAGNCNGDYIGTISFLMNYEKGKWIIKNPTLLK